MTPRARPGVTLVELIVVLTIIGVMAGVAGLAARRAAPVRETDARLAAVLAARRLAIDSARPVTVEIGGDTVPRRVTANPDGSVVADAQLGIDRLTGVAMTRGPAHAR